MNTVMRTIGLSIGGQIAATIVAGHTLNGLPTEHGYVLAFMVSFGILAICVLASTLVPRRIHLQ
jgi:hypothetical protein